MDAIAIEVLIEAKSVCPDRARAQAALADALASARAPRRGPNGKSWSVAVDVAGDAKTKTATARIVDDRGTLVAERTVTDRTACTPLARAIGAWASLVLDDELARAGDAAEGPPPGPAHDARAEKPLAPVQLDRSDWRTPDDDPDYIAPQRAKPWTLEIGLMGYVRDGLASSSGFAGGSAFAAIELSPGWFVRPALFVGTSTVQVEVDTGHRAAFTHVGMRGDFCRRIPGNYIERRGLELDLCLGGDLSGVKGANKTGTGEIGAARASVGPSAAFRGEIGTNANLELRVVSGYNLSRAPMAAESEVPTIFAQAEVGVSWRFR